MSVSEFQTPIVVGCDHAAYPLKEKVKAHLIEKGIKVEDLGTNSENSVDYSQFESILASPDLRILKAFLSANESGTEFEGRLNLTEPEAKEALLAILGSRPTAPLGNHVAFPAQLLVADKEMIAEWLQCAEVVIQRER